MVVKNQAAEPKLCSSGVTRARTSTGDLPATADAPKRLVAYSEINCEGVAVSHAPPPGSHVEGNEEIVCVGTA